MAPSSKIIALSLIAGASAAPLSLFGSSSGSTTATASVSSTTTTDIQTFANAFLNSATGGAVTTADTAAAKLSGVVSTAKAIAFNTWAAGQCVAASHDLTSCGEISAYLSAVYYAVEQGWSAAELFAALGTSRVSKFETLLQALCTDAPSTISGTCSTLLGTWPAYITAMTAVEAATATQAAAALTSNGILGLIDAAHIGTALMASIQATAATTTNGLNVAGLQLRYISERDLLNLGQTLTGVAGTVASGATSDATAALGTAAGLSIGQSGIHAVTDIGTQVGANVVAGATGAVAGLTSGIPVVGNVVVKVATTANAAVQAAGNANVASALNVVPGMASLTSTITGGAAAGTNALAGSSGLLSLRDIGINTHIPTVGNGLDLDIASLSKEIAEGDVFGNAHIYQRDLLSSLPVGSILSNSGILSTVTHLPVVGNVAAAASGAASSLTNIGASASQNGIQLGLNDVTGTAGSLLGSSGLSLKRSLLNGLPLLSSLPIGNVANTVENTVSSLPIVGNVAATATGALSSVTNLGAGINQNGVSAGVSDVTGVASSLLGSTGLSLKRDPSILSGLPIVGSLPVVGNVLNTADSTVSSLPVVGNVLNTVGNAVNTAEGTVAGLPVVGNVASTAAGLLSNIHLKRNPSLLSNLPIVSNLPVVGGLLQTVDNTASSLPVVGNVLSTVGGVANTATGIASSLPVVGNVAATASGALNSVTNVGAGLTNNGLTAGLGSVTGAAGSILGGAGLQLRRDPSLLSGLPVVGNVVNTVTGVASSLPVVGSVASTVQGQAASINNLGLGLGGNGLTASLSDVTGVAGSVLGGAGLHI